MNSKWNINKFFKDNYFVLWKVKIQEILTQKKCNEALKVKGLMPSLKQVEKINMVYKTKDTIIFCL